MSVYDRVRENVFLPELFLVYITIVVILSYVKYTYKICILLIVSRRVSREGGEGASVPLWGAKCGKNYKKQNKKYFFLQKFISEWPKSDEKVFRGEGGLAPPP